MPLAVMLVSRSTFCGEGRGEKHNFNTTTLQDEGSGVPKTSRRMVGIAVQEGGFRASLVLLAYMAVRLRVHRAQRSGSY